MILFFDGRLRILGSFLLFFALSARFSESVEDVKSRGFVLKGFINSESKKGEEVELQTSIGSVYGMRVFRGKNGSVDVCGYTVYEDGASQFKVIDVKKDTGEATLVLSKDLNAKVKNFSIEIAPHTCSTGRHLDRLQIFIQVISPYKWKPEWKEKSYSVNAVEGKFYSPLLKVELNGELEAGEFKGHGKVCQFKVVTKNVPFEVDENGGLINSEPLDVSRKDKWILEVVAESCEGQASDPLKVTVWVKPSCQPEWIGVPEKIEFSPHDGQKLLAQEAELSLCENTCNISSAFVSVKLSTAHIGKGCDRDTYSLDSQRKLCGASLNAIDLLPSPSAPNSWTKDLRTDDGKESDEVFAFDGKKDAIEVSEEMNELHLGRQFTISTWMKHEKEDESNDGSVARKENILCISDSQEMNRQHMALFLHRCHLVLLLRQEPGAGLERDAYAPAEWRWTLPEVCDGAWHHYAVNVYDGTKESTDEKSSNSDNLSAPLPKVKLHIDGKEFAQTRKNPNMVNDFPLHRSRIHATKTVVGGCWMGGMNRIRNYFKGYLAGLSLLNNQNEPGPIIECLTRCQEKLDITNLGEMEKGTTLSLNNDKTLITIGGSGLGQVESLLRKVAYVNSRNFPTPGLRPITFDTRVVCDNGKQVDVEVVKSLLLVSRIEKPLIVLKSSTHFQEEEELLKEGVAIFRDLDISTHSKSQADEVYQGVDGKKPQFMNKYHLDSCTVKLGIPLAAHIERLKISEDVSGRFKVKVASSATGINISGVDKLENYERLLSSVKYFNDRPSDLNQRSFALVCTELNGRYASNQLEVSMGVVHKVGQKVEPQAAGVHRMSRPVGSIVLGNEDSQVQAHLKSIGGEQSSGSATGVVIVCVVCIGFIALLAAVGISRIKNAQRHSRDAGVDDKQEMEWDNSALTITVNPMDQEGLCDDETSLASIINNNNNIGGVEDGNDLPQHHHHHHHHHHRHHHHHHHEDDDSEDDDASCHDSSCVDDEDEEEVQGKMKRGELEWDDSTLSY